MEICAYIEVQVFVLVEFTYRKNMYFVCATEVMPEGNKEIFQLIF